ncbi:MAG: isoprenyl transferase [Anaerolineales bacterium]|nr:isoprenyl transferase [Anaerolineales bacterium]
MAKESLKIPKKIPTHLAIIMDGNGRWALEKGLPRLAGHRAGTENLREVIEACAEFGIQYLTIYAFSTENWNRPPEEIQGLMKIFRMMLDRELNNLHEDGVQLRHIGRLDKIDQELRDKVKEAIQLTKDNKTLILNIAFNYGGRDEILHAVKQLMEDGHKAEDLDEDLFAKYLYTADSPDPDLIIRTSGEYRCSNFLIWQAAYSEWYFTSTYWPDFGREELHQALTVYDQRERRYGEIQNIKDV